MKFIFGSILITGALASTFYLPPLSGPNKVGTTSIKLVDTTRLDPFSPVPQNRTLLVTLFYPTIHTRAFSFANYTGPKLANHLDTESTLTGLFEQVKNRAYLDARMHKPYSSLVFFSPGLGGFKELYTSMVEDLASHGYIVVAMDHTYESEFVEFPDGTVIEARLPTLPIEELVEVVQKIRVADARFILNQLADKKIAKMIPGVHGGELDTTRVGFFGHSLGGSTAADTMLADCRFIAGLNLDGEFVGASAHGVQPNGTILPNPPNANLKRPFFIMGADRQQHNRTEDPTWTSFWDTQTGYKRNINVAGAIHNSYTDVGSLVDIVGVPKAALPPAVAQQFLGSIDGLRMNQIVTTYVAAFFDFAMKGKTNEILNRAVKEFPEVTFEY